jgi:hypothetical protein
LIVGHRNVTSSFCGGYFILCALHHPPYSPCGTLCLCLGMAYRIVQAVMVWCGACCNIVERALVAQGALALYTLVCGLQVCVGDKASTLFVTSKVFVIRQGGKV